MTIKYEVTYMEKDFTIIKQLHLEAANIKDILRFLADAEPPEDTVHISVGVG